MRSTGADKVSVYAGKCPKEVQKRVPHYRFHTLSLSHTSTGAQTHIIQSLIFRDLMAE